MEQYQIQDDSGDRNYFTIIPNYILNHSTATAQALYMQLKRLAGEKGIAYPSRKYLMEKLGITKPTLLKEIKYLIDHNWIEYSGEKTIMTNGGEQKIKTYKIIDLWKLNSDYYHTKGVKNNTPLDTKGVKNNIAKGVKNRPTNKNYILNKNQNIILATEESVADKINPIIDLFKTINPSYDRLFANKTQRGAIERLLKKYSQDQLDRIIKVAFKANQTKYAPRITTPLQLESKLGDLLFWANKNNKSNVATI